MRGVGEAKRLGALLCAAAATALVCAGPAAARPHRHHRPRPAAAQPQVTEVKGFYLGVDRTASYVLLAVSTTGGADHIQVSWPNMGGGYDQLQGDGTIGVGFANGAAGNPLSSYDVRISACRQGKCGSERGFSGGFTPMPPPPPNEANSQSSQTENGSLLPGIDLPPITIPGTPITPPIPLTGPGSLLGGVLGGTAP